MTSFFVSKPETTKRPIGRNTCRAFSVSGSKNEKENMGYSSGMLKYRVTILNKQVASGFGETTSYQPAATVWADVTWSKGAKALREGALDAYDTVLIRMRYNDVVTRDSRLQHGGVTYQIQSLHADRQANTIQITATEIVK
jgi:SPP1 family predicted phage head-tail adaptor